REARHAVMLHCGEVAEGVGIGQRAVLAEALLVVAALDVVEATRVAPVVAGVHPTLGVEFQAEGIAAALGEDLVTATLGVVAPDKLTHRVNGTPGADTTGLAGTLDLSGDGAALASVEPAVGAPAQAVDDRVRIFEPEAFQQHLGIAVGHVVVVAVRIEKQVRRVQYIHAAPAAGTRGPDAQPIDEGLLLVEDAAALGVPVNVYLFPSLHIG